MNDRPVDWESRVKQGLFTEEIFSSDMKRQVMDTLDRRPGYFSRQWKFLAGAVALSFISVIFAINGPYDFFGKGASGLKDEKGMPVVFQPLIASNWEMGETSNQADPDILPGLSNQYNPLRNKTNGHIAQIPYSDIQLLDEKPIDGFGMALHYTLKPDSVTPHETNGDVDYFGFILNESSQPENLYHYGYGHLYDLQFSTTRLFGQEVLKIEGANCRTDGESCVWYVRKDSDGQVYSYMSLEAASYERDLDGDGKEEAVVVTRKLNQIYIFKEQDGKLLWSSVRETLKANQNDIIQYDDASGTFTIHSILGEGKYTDNVYAYKEGSDSLIRMDSRGRSYQ